jgi:hypothetical protein
MRKLARLCLIAAVLLAGLRLFLGIVTLPDDATTLLIVKPQPSFALHLRSQPEGARVLLTDENGIPGQQVIEFALGYGWVLAWLLSVALRAIDRTRR